MKVSTGHAVYVGESRIRERNPPGSPQAIAAIHKVGIELNGPEFRPWETEDRAAMYRGEYRNLEPIGTNTYKCRGCGCMISVKERCKPCQQEFRANGYQVTEEVSA